MPWYERSFRRNLIDMHIAADNPEYLCRFDPHFYFDCLKKAHIQSPMIYLQSHVGLCNWDSASGATHPAFKGNNKIKTLIDLCHAGGMEVVAYYSLIYNNWAHENHPAWRLMRLDGRDSRASGRYGLVCPNNPEYRAFTAEQCKELSSVYDFEGIFLDMTFWPYTCYCASCRERYLREEGAELPTLADWNDPQWRNFQSVRERWLGEFARFATGAIKAEKPGVTVEHQFSTAAQSWTRGVTGAIAEASDYAGGDLYGGFGEQSFISKLYYEITPNQPFEYMTSRCDPNLQAHTTTKSLESLMQHNFLTMSHHGAFLAIDAIDPRGTIDPRVYERLGKVFEASMPYEPYLRGDLAADTALYFSFGSKYDPQAIVAPPDAAEQEYPQLKGLMGAAKTLRGAHVPHTCVPGNRTDEIFGRKLVILSEAAFLTDAERAALTNYVRGGGCLYMSGSTDPRLVAELMDIHVTGYTKEDRTYVAPTELGKAAFGEYSADFPLAYPGRQAIAEIPEGLPVLATLALPYTDPADVSRFATLHANPPGPPTALPALVLATCGKGRALWSSAAFEGNAQLSHGRVFLHLLRLLCADLDALSLNAPPFIELIRFDDSESNCTYVHAVNVLDMEPLVGAGTFAVTVSGGVVKGVTLLPDEKAVPFVDMPCGGCVFETEGTMIHKMWKISWGD